MPDAILTILGSGTCAATKRRSMAGYSLQAGGQHVLLDIGDGVLRRMLEAGLDYRNVDAIFITHFHIDHIADFLPFLWAIRYTPDYHRDVPLYLFGPPGTQTWYRHLSRAFGDWLLELPFPVEIREVEKTTWEWQGFRISTLPMHHVEPANGYRFEFAQTAFVYTGDTGYHENVIRLAQKADWLLIECSFPDKEEAIETHMTPSRVANIAAQAAVKNVILTHMYPECEKVDLVAACKKTFSGHVFRAEDLQQFQL